MQKSEKNEKPNAAKSFACCFWKLKVAYFKNKSILRVSNKESEKLETTSPYVYQNNAFISHNFGNLRRVMAPVPFHPSGYATGLNMKKVLLMLGIEVLLRLVLRASSLSKYSYAI